MNYETKKAILDKIESYQTIIITRHIRPDGDAVGSTKGLKEILKLTYPEKDIYVINSDKSDYLAFLGAEDDEIDLEKYKDALAIVLDTGNKGRISNKNIEQTKELIKIDHHVDIEPYGDIFWVEDQRSSVCEMVADFYNTFKDKLKMNSVAATYIYTGMVTDSGRFKYEGTNGDTLRLAGMLLDYGIDTSRLFAHLYLEEYDFIKFKADMLKNVCRTENGVAYLYIDTKLQKDYNLTIESASNCIGFIDSIKGCLVWLAFIETEETVRVRLRSRFMPVNKIGEMFNGGGHEFAAGATVKNKEEAMQLISIADKQLGDFKASHDDWM